MAPSQQSLRPITELAAIMQHPRLSQIVQFIWQNREEILSTDKLQIVFDCAGSKVEAKVTKRLSCPK